MATVGGSVQEVSIKGRTFAVAADADANKSLGGWSNAVEPNGNASARLIKTRVAWNVDGLALSVDHDRADLEFLQDVADSNDFVEMSVTFADGVTYAGKGTVIGEVKGSSKSATATVTLGGPSKLSQQ